MRKLVSLVFRIVLSGCPSYEVGFTQSLYRAVERDFKHDPADCVVMGSSVICERPGQSTVMINWTRDEAEIAEATVVLCGGDDCTVQYRITCDLAGCVRHDDTKPDTWNLR